jgi:uncharacterized membrane protein YczE
MIRTWWQQNRLKSLIYFCGLFLLGITVTLIQQTNLGMASWDAFARNLYEGIPLDYKFLTPIIALVLIPIAYLIQKKKWSLLMLFPLGISFVIGSIIDFLLLVIPSVAGLGLLWNLSYLALALLICAVGLNLIVWCRFPMPALDELCYGFGVFFHISYGKGKLIGEVLALGLAVVFGLIFHHQSVYFFIGPTTIIFAIAIGPLIDWFAKPIRKGLDNLANH